MGLFQEGIPTKSSIAVWVEKLGVYPYTHPQKPAQPYGLILDECMVIGQQRLMVCLAVNAQKQVPAPTTFADVRVVHLQVSTSWTGEHIKAMLEQVSQKQGFPPAMWIVMARLICGKGWVKAGIFGFVM